MNRPAAISLLALAWATPLACSEAVGTKARPDAPSPTTPDAGEEAGETSTDGDELRITVPASGRVYASLKSPPSTKPKERRSGR